MGKNDINTEQRILEAAKTVFMQYGVYGARMQEIANTAGINKALLHYYFRSKEKLFDAVFEGALEKYFNQMNVLSDESLPLIQRIHGYIDNIFAFYKEYPQMSLFIIKEITVNPELFRQKVQSIKQTQGPLLITALKESVQKGELQDFDPLTFLVNLHSLCTYPFLAAPIFKVIADVADLSGRGASTAKADGGKKVAAKYRDPASGQTWSGRGLKPKWLQAALAAGKSLNDFAL